MFTLIMVVCWILAGIGTGMLVFWLYINYNKHIWWQEAKVEEINRDILFIFWFSLAAWPIALCFVLINIFVLSNKWYQHQLDNLAKWLFVHLKRKP